MKKKLYFVVEKELDESDSLNGNKTITLYSIENNEPKVFATIDSTNELSTRTVIRNYMDDNGYQDDEFELKQL